MRAFSRGSDGLAEICEDDAKNVIIPLLSDDVRDGLSEYVENLQRGTTTINSVVKQLIKDERIAYNDPDKRPSHIVIVSCRWRPLSRPFCISRWQTESELFGPGQISFLSCWG